MNKAIRGDFFCYWVSPELSALLSAFYEIFYLLQVQYPQSLQLQLLWMCCHFQKLFQIFSILFRVSNYFRVTKIYYRNFLLFLVIFLLLLFKQITVPVKLRKHSFIFTWSTKVSSETTIIFLHFSHDKIR